LLKVLINPSSVKEKNMKLMRCVFI